MGLVIMAIIILLASINGWQIYDNALILVTIIISYLSYRDVKNKDDEYYGGY